MSEAYDIARTMRRLTVAQRRNLMALPMRPGTWLTVAEMRGNGATGSGMDILHVFHSPKLSERRWVRWGGEPNQTRGEGYEYTITPFGATIRDQLSPSPMGGEDRPKGESDE